MEITAEQNERLSRILRSALDTNQDGKISVGEVADRLAERGFGFLLVLLALPGMVPMPPGTSGPIGILMGLLGAQMLFGRTLPWLPQRVRNHVLSERAVRVLQTNGIALFRKMENLSRPRFSALENPITLRVVALLIIALGVILALPIPFMNSLPGILVLVLAIGLLNRDGLFLLAGVSCGAVLVLTLLLFANRLDDLARWMSAWATSLWR